MRAYGAETRRVLRDKFLLGLFDNPCVDLIGVERVVGAAGELAQRKSIRLADFDANDAAVLDVICSQFLPSGRLPYELPSSMEAVRAQKSDVPYDSGNPLFPFGFGLTY